MAAQTTRARPRRCGKSRVSWTLAAEGTTPSGRPSVETTTWYLVPALPRSVGLGPVRSPPRLARTEQLSTTTSHGASSGPERTMRISAAWTWRNRAGALPPARRRGEEAGPGARQAGQRGMVLAQQGGGAPGVQAAAQGGPASTPGGGPQLAPLHAFTDAEPACRDDLAGRHGRAA